MFYTFSSVLELPCPSSFGPLFPTAEWLHFILQWESKTQRKELSHHLTNNCVSLSTSGPLSPFSSCVVYDVFLWLQSLLLPFLQTPLADCIQQMMFCLNLFELGGSFDPEDRSPFLLEPPLLSAFWLCALLYFFSIIGCSFSVSFIIFFAILHIKM